MQGARARLRLIAFAALCVTAAAAAGAATRHPGTIGLRIWETGVDKAGPPVKLLADAYPPSVAR